MQFYFYWPDLNSVGGGAVANVLDCDILVSEFELKSRYYVYFRTNTFRKVMNTLILPTCVSVKYYS